MSYKILSINPGSTSTKIALCEDEKELFSTTIRHTDEELAPFPEVASQYDFRKQIIVEELKKQGYEEKDLAAVVGRGGIFPNIKAGGYLVNDAMKAMIFEGNIIPHASNLGALISDAIAKPLGIPAYVYDCVSSDEITEVAKITGLVDVVKKSTCHVLNSKATSRKVAEKIGKKYEDMNFIVAHLGGGISVSAHKKGQIVDCIPDDSGPFSPERAGAIPALDMVEICYSGKYTKKEMGKVLRGNGGLKSLLGTNDCIEVENRVLAGDPEATLIYQAMAYQIARGICSLLPALEGKVHAIVLTGGIAYSKPLIDMIKEYFGSLFKVEVYPGENEMEALTLGALRMLSGEEQVKEYE